MNWDDGLPGELEMDESRRMNTKAISRLGEYAMSETVVVCGICLHA